MRLLQILLGLIIAQVSIIIAFHTSHMILAVIMLFGGVMMMLNGLPSTDQNERLRRYD